jgi:hypothetical protein
MAGARHCSPLRFDLAWHRNAWCIGKCLGLFSIFSAHPSPLGWGDVADDRLPALGDVDVLDQARPRPSPPGRRPFRRTTHGAIRLTVDELRLEHWGALSKQKDLLGYHDIRLGNEPDVRLDRFVNTNLPKLVSDARQRFEEASDLLADFAAGVIPYEEFAARIRRRESGTNEDNDWES